MTGYYKKKWMAAGPLGLDFDSIIENLVPPFSELPYYQQETGLRVLHDGGWIPINFIQAPPPAASVQSDRNRNFKKENVEYRITNIECRREVFCLS